MPTDISDTSSSLTVITPLMLHSLPIVEYDFQSSKENNGNNASLRTYLT